MLPNKVPIQQTVRNKLHIPKIMFMCAVARPCHDHHNNRDWDGLIGIWPYVRWQAAIRNSVNRPRGTMEMKAINSVTAAHHRAMMIDNVIPAIKQKWPTRRQTIRIQQDNCRVHTAVVDRQILAAANVDGWNMELRRQPPRSPDLNVLDLGFFNSIQSIQHTHAPHNLPELVQAVQRSFTGGQRDGTTLNKVWLSWQSVMIDVLRTDGMNDSPLRHMGKDSMLRRGALPAAIECPAELIESGREFIRGWEPE